MKKLFFLLAAFTTVLAAQAQSGLVGIIPAKTVNLPKGEVMDYLFEGQVGPTITKAAYLESWDVELHSSIGRGLIIGWMSKFNENSNFAFTGGKEIEIDAATARLIFAEYFHEIPIEGLQCALYGIDENGEPGIINRLGRNGELSWGPITTTGKAFPALTQSCANAFAYKIPDLSGVTLAKVGKVQDEDPKIADDDDSEDVDEKGGDSETDVTVETDGKTIIIKNNITVHGATATITNSGNSTNTGGNSTVAPSGQGNNTAPTLWDAQVPVQPFTVQQQPQYQQPQQQQGGGQCNHGTNNCSCSNYVASGQTQVVRTYPPGTGFALVMGGLGLAASGAGDFMLGIAGLNGQLQDQNTTNIYGNGTTPNPGPGFTPVGIETNGSGTFGANGIGTTWP